jgi:surface antigen
MGPSGLVQNGCGNHCTSRDYYLPGKGVWADDKPVDKSTIGAGIGTILGVVITHSSGDPLIISAAAVAGMFLGHEVGATFDKIDHMYLHTIFQQSLTNNSNMQSTTWKHPQKNYVINSLPVNTKGGCREFVTSVQSGNGLKQVRGNACFINNEWEVMEIY